MSYLGKLPSGLTRYLFVGGLSFAIDAGSFAILLYLSVYRPIASAVSFILGTCCHFILNRSFSFKNFDRPIRQQIGTYVVVSAFCLILTVGIIEVMAGVLRVPSMIAKIMAIAINLPVGFFGHKYLTFGGRIKRAVLRQYERFVEGTRQTN